MKLPFEIWIALFLITGVIIVTITSPSFWKVMKMRKKCKACYGAGGDIIDGENIWLDCPECGGKI